MLLSWRLRQHELPRSPSPRDVVVSLKGSELVNYYEAIGSLRRGASSKDRARIAEMPHSLMQ